MKHVMFAALIAMLVTVVSQAQEDVSIIAIKTLSLPEIDLKKVAVAKITTKGKLTLVVPQFQEETRTRTKRVLQYRKQQRMRSVNVNGERVGLGVEERRTRVDPLAGSERRRRMRARIVGGRCT